MNQAFFFKEEISLFDSLIVSDFSFYSSKWISDRFLTFVISGSFSGEYSWFRGLSIRRTRILLLAIALAYSKLSSIISWIQYF